MRKTTVLVTFIVFLMLVAGGVVTVLALGTSTGVAMGGGSTVTGVATANAPFTAQSGWIRNNSPWPVEIQSIAVGASATAQAPLVYLSETKTAPAPVPAVEGDDKDEKEKDAQVVPPPAWAGTPLKFPYTLKGGDLRYFGFSVVPEEGKIGSLSSVTVTFSGPLGFTFTSSYDGVAIAASPENLPNELIATDPAVDPASLDSYLALLRSALKSGDGTQIHQVMGDSASREDGASLKKSQKGYSTKMKVEVTRVTEDGRTQTIQFYKTDLAKDALKPITVQWVDFRWGVTAWE